MKGAGGLLLLVLFTVAFGAPREKWDWRSALENLQGMDAESGEGKHHRHISLKNLRQARHRVREELKNVLPFDEEIVRKILSRQFNYRELAKALKLHRNNHNRDDSSSDSSDSDDNSASNNSASIDNSSDVSSKRPKSHEKIDSSESSDSSDNSRAESGSKKKNPETEELTTSVEATIVNDQTSANANDYVVRGIDQPITTTRTAAQSEGIISATSVVKNDLGSITDEQTSDLQLGYQSEVSSDGDELNSVHTESNDTLNTVATEIYATSVQK